MSVKRVDDILSGRSITAKELSWEEIPKKHVFYVRRDSPAATAIRRASMSRAKPGTIYFVSNEEFESLREDMLAVVMDD